MANEFYTLIVVPHAKARFRKFQVPVRLTKWVLGASGSTAVVVLALLLHFSRMAGEVYQLRAQNTLLTSKNQEYQQTSAKLQAKVANLQSVVTKLGVMAGLEQILRDPKVGSVGGLSNTETQSPSAEGENL